MVPSEWGEGESGGGRRGLGEEEEKLFSSSADLVKKKMSSCANSHPSDVFPGKKCVSQCFSPAACERRNTAELGGEARAGGCAS